MRSSMRSRAATCCCGAGWSSSRTIPSLSCRHIATLPPPWRLDLIRNGQKQLIDALRVGLVAPVLGLGGLQVPVGSHGRLRTGVQIVTSRFREDLALDAGEVIEAAEGIVEPIDPMW